MSIWNASAHKVLQLFLSSTAEKHYVSELVDKTGLSRATLSPMLNAMAEAGLLELEKERPSYDNFNRAKRHYYRLTPIAAPLLRLERN